MCEKLIVFQTNYVFNTCGFSFTDIFIITIFRNIVFIRYTGDQRRIKVSYALDKKKKPPHASTHITR